MSEIDFEKQTRVRPAPGAPGILVAHLSAAPKPYVYVGRVMPGIPASPLGNPYKGDGAIERFRGWLRDAYKASRDGTASQEQHAAAAELQRLAELFREEGRLVLACWCSPEPCHADVIAAAVVGIVAAEPVVVTVGGAEACAHYDRELAEEGLPWVVSQDGRVLRCSASLRQAREPLVQRGPVVVSLGGSAQLAELGMGKCDSCGQVKAGIGHKEICAECRAWAQGRQLERLAAQWAAVLRDVRPISPSVESVLFGARPVAVADGVVTLEAQTPFHQSKLSEPKICKVVERVLSTRLGGPHTITVTLRAAEQAA